MNYLDLPPVERMARRRPRVVIVGAGFGGLTLTRRLGSVPVDVTLIDRNNYHLFTPLIYQVATGMLSPADIADSVRGQIRSVRNAEFFRATVTGIDTEANHVLTEAGSVEYDYLVLAAGSVTNDFGDGYVTRFAHSLKDLPDALDARNVVMNALEHWRWENDPQRRRALVTFAIVGGGPIGVEYAGALSELVRTSLRKDFHDACDEAQVVLIEMGKRILPMFDEPLSEAASRSLEKKGVSIRTGTTVKSIGAGWIELGDSTRLELETVIWAAGVRASSIGSLLGVELGPQRRVPVTASLRVNSMDNVFVIGDMAAYDHLPMLSRPAIEEAEYVARAIHSLMLDHEPRPFVYRDPGIMAVVGRGSAVAQIGPLRLKGLVGWAAWAALHIYLINTFRSRIATLVNWAWAYLFREPAARIEVRPAEPPVTERYKTA